jgi:glucose-6-phosphate dehydrogenase assembly protein OpcA
VATELITNDWTGEDVTIAQIERELARLRFESSGEGQPNLRTSVMTHIAWAPPEWQSAAEETLSGMAERHPSRTLLLVPKRDEPDGLDAQVSIRCFPVGDRAVCGEVIELVLRGKRALAPASIALPLLISDLPVFCRWRGQPEWDSPEFEQLVGIVDRLIVDSTEWPDLPDAYASLVELFPRVVVSDIAWERTERWRSLLASLWPEIAKVKAVRVHGTRAQAHLLAGWLGSRLGHEVELEIEEREKLEGIDLDGKPAPFPPG